MIHRSCSVGVADVTPGSPSAEAGAGGPTGVKEDRTERSGCGELVSARMAFLRPPRAASGAAGALSARSLCCACVRWGLPGGRIALRAAAVAAPGPEPFDSLGDVQRADLC